MSETPPLIDAARKVILGGDEQKIIRYAEEYCRTRMRKASQIGSSDARRRCG